VSFTHDIVLAAQQLPLPHRDPADRFLAATAQVMDLRLVTSDDLLLGLETIPTSAIFVDEKTISPADIGGIVWELIHLSQETGRWDWTDRVYVLRR
jgi:hypothetical protein